MATMAARVSMSFRIVAPRNRAPGKLREECARRGARRSCAPVTRVTSGFVLEAKKGEGSATQVWPREEDRRQEEPDPNHQARNDNRGRLRYWLESPPAMLVCAG